LMRVEKIEKFYLSHLNYGGRGNKNRGDDAIHAVTRAAMDLLFAAAWDDSEAGIDREYVTGNNDADGVYLLLWAGEKMPENVAHLQAKLRQWGGNSSGVNVANIDNVGNVHPDTFWWHHTLGNVRKIPFSKIWTDLSDPLLAGLKARPRRVGGRCGACAHFSICGGNTRVRAHQISGDPWAEDPGCYLTDVEIGVAPGPRLQPTPYQGRRRNSVHA
jgi:radical SAM protein with 4Fe4S-binding SPASM domain